MTATGPDRPDLRLRQLSPPPPPRRRPQLVIVVLLAALLVAVAGAVVLGYEYGNSRNGDHRAAPSPSPSTATGQFSATPASPTTTTIPPPRPRVLTLITKDLAYLAPGQAGTQPSFVVRAGERLRMRVDNKDAYKHSFTFVPSKVDLDAGEHTVSVTGPFRAPTKAGTYSFYCKYRYTGMDGRIIVGRS